MRKILIIIVLILLSINTVSAYCPSNWTSTKRLTTSETWTDCNLLGAGDLIAGHNIVLTLENTTLEINNTYDYQYVIILEANAIFFVNNSTISSKNKYWSKTSLEGTNNTQIRSRSNSSYPTEKPTIHTLNTNLSFLGRTRAHGNGDLEDSYGVNLEVGTSYHTFNNTTFSYYDESAVYFTGTSNAQFDNCSFINLGHSSSSVGTAAIMWNGASQATTQLRITNTTFDGIYGLVDAEPWYVNTGTDGYVYNVTIKNQDLGAHNINFYARGANWTIKKLFSDDPSRAVTFNNDGTQTYNQNITMEDWVWHNNATTYMSGCCAVIGASWRNKRFYINNFTLYGGDALLFSSGNSVGYPAHSDSIITNITWNGTDYYNTYNTQHPFQGNYNNVTYSDVRITSDTGTYYEYFWIVPNTVGYQTLNSRFTNFTIIGKHGSANGCDGSVNVNDAQNNIFRDWYVNTSGDTGNSFCLQSGVYNNKWINIYDENRVIVSSGNPKYEKYHYIDVLVQNNLSEPISGATVTFQNTVNLNYPAINRIGTNKSSFITGANGHLSLPLESDANTAIITSSIKTSSGTTFQGWNISASKDGNQSNTTYFLFNSSTDQLFYRSDLNTAPYTITLTINEAQSDPIQNYIPPDPIILTSGTSGFNATYTWQAGNTSSNITNSFNVSWNGAWENNTGILTKNTYVGPHGYANITLFAYNSSGTGELSGSISDSHQVPNNEIDQEVIGAQSVVVGNTLFINISSTDADLDTITYETNATVGSLDSGTGQYSWTPSVSDVGVYYWAFNSTNSTWGGNASETITISVLNTTTIYGYVNTTSLVPCSACNVYLSYTNNSMDGLFKTITDSGGYYAFEGVTIDSYYVFAEQVNESSNRTANFTLNAEDYWQNLTLIDDGIALSANESYEIDLSSSFDYDADSLTYSTNGSAYCSDFSTVTGIGNCSFAEGGNYSINFGVIDSDGFYTNSTVLFSVEATQSSYKPATPSITGMTTGDYFKNLTWVSGGGANITDGYNLSRNGTWYNGTALFLNTTSEAGAWVNDTLYSWNSSNGGTLSDPATNNTQMEQEILDTLLTDSYNISIFNHTSASTYWVNTSLNYTILNNTCPHCTYTVNIWSYNNTYNVLNDYSLNESYTIENILPILSPIGSKIIPVSSYLNFTVNASDGDGDLLEFSENSSGTIDLFNGTFSWKPETPGNYSVNFSVFDGYGGNDSEIINIQVLDLDIPGIVSYSNNKTNNDTLQITVNLSEAINFNATANQSGSWNWYLDNVNQSVNFNNITLSWNTTGSKVLKVNITNYNGTSNTVTWAISVIERSFKPPVPSITSVNQGYYWKNITYSAGAGNITNSFNISRNGTWYNGSTLFLNTSTIPETYINDTIYAWNSSNNGTLSDPVTSNTYISEIPVSYYVLSGIVSPAGSTIEVTGHGSQVGGSYSFGQVFLWNESVWINVSGSGYYSNNSLVTFNSSNISWNVSLQEIPPEPQYRLSGIVLPSNATVAVSGHGTIPAGVYDFGEVFDGTEVVWFNVSRTGYYPNNTLLTFDNSDISWNVTLQAIPPSPGPTISSWGNNLTNDQDLTISANRYDTILFNVSANQSVNLTWTNANNGVKSFTSSGVQNVSVYGTNENGTTQTITWSVTVTNPDLGDINGYLRDSNGNFLNGTVLINGDPLEVNSSGYFQFVNKTPGTYYLQGVSSGYTSYTKTITMVDDDVSYSFSLNSVSSGGGASEDVMMIISVLLLVLVGKVSSLTKELKKRRF